MTSIENLNIAGTQIRHVHRSLANMNTFWSLLDVFHGLDPFAEDLDDGSKTMGQEYVRTYIGMPCVFQYWSHNSMSGAVLAPLEILILILNVKYVL